MIFGDVMAKCPKCGKETDKVVKTWEIKSPKSTHKLRVKIMLCTNCGHKFRIVEKV